MKSFIQRYEEMTKVEEKEEQADNWRILIISSWTLPKSDITVWVVMKVPEHFLTTVCSKKKMGRKKQYITSDACRGQSHSLYFTTVLIFISLVHTTLILSNRYLVHKYEIKRLLRRCHFHFFQAIYISHACMIIFNFPEFLSHARLIESKFQ